MSARTGIYDEAGVGHPATSDRLYEAIRAANKINPPRVSDRTMGKSELGKNPFISQPGGHYAIGDLQSRASSHDGRTPLAPLATPRRGVPGNQQPGNLEGRRAGDNPAVGHPLRPARDVIRICPSVIGAPGGWGILFSLRATRRATRLQISIQPPRCVFILTVSVQAARARSKSKHCKPRLSRIMSRPGRLRFRTV